jgi:hypothetical protein
MKKGRLEQGICKHKNRENTPLSSLKISSIGLGSRGGGVEEGVHRYCGPQSPCQRSPPSDVARRQSTPSPLCPQICWEHHLKLHE